MGGSSSGSTTGGSSTGPMIHAIATHQKKDNAQTRDFDQTVRQLDFDQTVRRLTQAAADLLISKHNDYGPLNISRSPGGALNGLRVRIWDKLARINNLVESGAAPAHESLRDSFIDMANYSLIAVMVLEGTWPNE